MSAAAELPNEAPPPSDGDYPGGGPRRIAPDRPMFDLGVERALIGVTLVNPTEAATATTALTTGDFYGPEHVALWDAITQVVAEIGAADEVLVRHRAIAHGLAPDVLDRLLLDCLASPGAPSRAQHYIATLRGLALRREMVFAAAELQRAAVEGDDTAARRAVERLNNTRNVTTTEVSFVDWASTFVTAADGEVAVVDGFLFPGRWTSVVAPAKQGKSEWSIIVGHSLARGLDPIGETRGREPMAVLYLDSENGRLDVVDRLMKADLTPDDLGRFHYTDIPEPLNTPAGGAKLLAAVRKHQAQVVIIDGINGFVQGDENDASTWIPFYNYTIAELKALGVAILTNDNQGRSAEKRAGGRGSTVKIDKADIVFLFTQAETDGCPGAKLERTHTRTGLAAEHLTMKLLGLHGEEALRYVPALGTWPQDTARIARLLDGLGANPDVSVRAARQMLKASGEKVANETLSAAIRWRKSLRNTVTEHSYAQPRNTVTERAERKASQASDQDLNVAEHSAERPVTEPEGKAEQFPPYKGGTFRSPPVSPVDNPDPMEEF
jgi:hypothetical protein